MKVIKGIGSDRDFEMGDSERGGKVDLKGLAKRPRLTGVGYRRRNAAPKAPAQPQRATAAGGVVGRRSRDPVRASREASKHPGVRW